LHANGLLIEMEDVYGKVGLKEEALLWLDRMISQGLWPDEVIVNTVVHILKEVF